MSLNSDVAAIAKVDEAMMARFIIDAAQEVFSTMVGLTIVDKYPLSKPVTKFHCSVTGIVGLAGIYSGMLSIHCPRDLAGKITSSMLGMDDEVSADDISDALGEISNMLGGHVKQILSKGGSDLNLSIPTVIAGEEYSINTIVDDDCVVIPFDCEEASFLIGLTLRKE
jgi:chemotaxis protein CheX